MRCVVNDDLKEEWEKYLEQTKNHVRIVQGTMEELGLDLEVETPGRLVVRHTGESLVKAMNMALEAGEKTKERPHAGRSGIRNPKSSNTI